VNHQIIICSNFCAANNVNVCKKILRNYDKFCIILFKCQYFWVFWIKY